LLGVRSDVPKGVLATSVPAAPAIDAPGDRWGAGLSGVRSEVLLAAVDARPLSPDWAVSARAVPTGMAKSRALNSKDLDIGVFQSTSPANYWHMPLYGREALRGNETKVDNRRLARR